MARAIRILSLVVLVLGAAPAPASHSDFHFTVDRFEIDGNVLGPHDGSPDFVEEFDDGVLGPNWFVRFGTAYESDGRLHLTSPGTHFPGPDGTTLDLSNVINYGGVNLGGGDFTGTSWWDPAVLDSGDLIHMTLWSGLNGSLLLFGIDMQQRGLGLVIEQHLVVIELANGIYDTVYAEQVPIAQDDITGQIVFRITYDESMYWATSSFSLDGGATFRSPFQSHFPFGGYFAEFVLGADPLATPLTTTTTSSTTSSTTTTSTTSSTSSTLGPPPCASTGCRESTASRAGRLVIDDKAPPRHDALVWRWMKGEGTSRDDFGNPLGFDGVTLCAWDGAFRVLANTTVPPAGLCSGQPCWRETATGFRLRDRSGIHGGVQKIALAAGGDGRAKITVAGQGDGLGLPSFPLTLPVTIQLRSGTGACWEAHYFATGVILNGETRFVGRPGSPSGAFLD
jgi:hypothetical protein